VLLWTAALSFVNGATPVDRSCGPTMHVTHCEPHPHLCLRQGSVRSVFHDREKFRGCEGLRHAGSGLRRPAFAWGSLWRRALHIFMCNVHG
jgi:hypothetical protein